ncbi:MAG: hypothetical protein AAB656_03170 [Patescibacteria group bacterium]
MERKAGIDFSVNVANGYIKQILRTSDYYSLGLALVAVRLNDEFVNSGRFSADSSKKFGDAMHDSFGQVFAGIPFYGQFKKYYSQVFENGNKKDWEKLIKFVTTEDFNSNDIALLTAIQRYI